MADGRDDRFNGSYYYVIKATDFFGGNCYGQGKLDVNGGKSQGSFELDQTKPNAWYCGKANLEFEFESKVISDNKVKFSAKFFSKTITSTATFKNTVDQQENKFKTNVMGAVTVHGKITRQPK